MKYVIVFLDNLIDYFLDSGSLKNRRFMSICVLLTTEFPYRRGETFLENEICYLAKKFNKVLIFSLYGKSSDAVRPIPKNCKSYPLHFSHSALRHFPNAVMGLINNREPFLSAHKGNKRIIDAFAQGRSESVSRKIVTILSKEQWLSEGHSFLVYSYWLTDLALAACKIDRMIQRQGLTCSCVSRCHRYDLYEERNKYCYLPFRRELLSCLDGVYPCSDDGVRYLKTKYPLESSKVFLSRLGTEDHGINPPPSEKDKVVFVTCSNLIPVKRVELFATALSIAKKSGLRFVWHCFGDGPNMDAILSIVKENGMEHDCCFHGRKTNLEVLDFYSKYHIDFFVNVSSSEGVPVSIMEAESFGIPCLATNVGGSAEIVSESNGVLLPATVSPEDLASTLMDLSSWELGRIEEMRNKARQTWETHSNAKEVFADWALTLRNFVLMR